MAYPRCDIHTPPPEIPSRCVYGNSEFRNLLVRRRLQQRAFRGKMHTRKHARCRLLRAHATRSQERRRRRRRRSDAMMAITIRDGCTFYLYRIKKHTVHVLAHTRDRHHRALSLMRPPNAQTRAHARLSSSSTRIAFASVSVCPTHMVIRNPQLRCADRSNVRSRNGADRGSARGQRGHLSIVRISRKCGRELSGSRGSCSCR